MSLNAPEQLMGRCVPTVRKSQVKCRAGCPGEVAPLGSPTLTRFFAFPPGHCRGREGCRSGQQDAPAATVMPCSVARDQRSMDVSLASAVPPTALDTTCFCSPACGAAGELEFGHSPVPCGTMCGRGNVLIQRGRGALDQGLPPSGASSSSWHLPGAATVPKFPQLPLLGEPEGLG